MEEFQSYISTVMRDLVSMCLIPVIVLLLAGVILAVCCFAWLVAEYFTERRHFKVFFPRLVDELRASVENSAESTREVLRNSGLLMRQKRYLLELTLHPTITADMRESMATDIEYRERRHYDGIVKITDLLSRIGPMLGLMGTLIPLGPGILALGEGDTETLSESLITAFDTTTVGLLAACFALVISAIRRRWYKDYLTSFDAAMECVLEVERLRWGEQGRPVVNDTADATDDAKPHTSDAELSERAGAERSKEVGAKSEKKDRGSVQEVENKPFQKGSAS